MKYIKKLLKILIGIAAFFLIINISWTLLMHYAHKQRAEELESIRMDYQNHRDIFESVVTIFPDDKHYRISARDYDISNQALQFIFEELNYTEIFSDFRGNIFFNKFDEGLTFDGLVYVRNLDYIYGIPKSEIVFLEQAKRWVAYYLQGL